METAPATQDPHPVWRQVTIGFTDYTSAEQTVATHLQPMMDAASHSWWFIRKAPVWRLRYLPTATNPAVHDPIHQGLEALQTTGQISSWTETIYEPELHAFGGPDAMTTAHQLFCHDSHHILTHSTGQQHRREHTILIVTALLRAAGQDWYEQGDVWARVADNRPLQAPDPCAHELAPAVRRFMTVDTRPGSLLTAPSGQLADITAWIQDVHTAGASLSGLHQHGRLQRGLRAVLAHHILFHWNRLGLTYKTQSTLAHAARHAVFDAP
ncbi:thiopeptide-type bacteriocin biosynthesis protein [Kribbella sp. DT2]|uniref:thiopeptide-type bacteriocin biosynthesis protein n=1 Tax=Kribbella sp. DT2 TaxID=3393427 RepID=UPI003CF24B25